VPIEAEAYEQAVNRLQFEGLIARNDDRQVFLTDNGLKSALAEFRRFPSDAWFEPRKVTDAEISEAATTFANLGNA